MAYLIQIAARARELESALARVRKTASGEALTTDQGRGLVDIIARYTQIEVVHTKLLRRGQVCRESVADDPSYFSIR
ncbi:MAG: hypothetical protein ACRET5_11180 [Steroidobacteraceae bacterium]